MAWQTNNKLLLLVSIIHKSDTLSEINWMDFSRTQLSFTPFQCFHFCYSIQFCCLFFFTRKLTKINNIDVKFNVYYHDKLINLCVQLTHSKSSDLKRVNTLICHTTMHRNSINVLYNPVHVNLCCLEVVPVVYARVYKYFIIHPDP